MLLILLIGFVFESAGVVLLKKGMNRDTLDRRRAHRHGYRLHQLSEQAKSKTGGSSLPSAVTAAR